MPFCAEPASHEPSGQTAGWLLAPTCDRSSVPCRVACGLSVVAAAQEPSSNENAASSARVPGVEYEARATRTRLRRAVFPTP